MAQQPPASNAQPSRYSLTISMEKANANALLIAPFVVAILAVPYILLWGFGGLLGWLTGSVLAAILVVPVLVASFYLHELLHGLGFVLVGRVPRSEVKIGFSRKALSPYAHCPVAMTASAYKVALVLPGFLLGVVPALIGIGLGVGWLTMYGMMMAVAALGDAQIAWLMRRLPGSTRVIDHPEEAGCEVLVE
jgi:hypothetical protein